MRVDTEDGHFVLDGDPDPPTETETNSAYSESLYVHIKCSAPARPLSANPAVCGLERVEVACASAGKCAGRAETAGGVHEPLGGRRGRRRTDTDTDTDIDVDIDTDNRGVRRAADRVRRRVDRDARLRCEKIGVR